GATEVPLFAGIGLFNTALGRWLSSFKVKASTKAALEGASLLTAVFTGVSSFVAKLAKKAVRAGTKALGRAFRRFRRPGAARGGAGPLGLLPGVKMSGKQFGKKWGKHASDYGLDPSDAASRSWFKDRIRRVASDYDEVRQGPWYPNAGGGSDYLFYRSGNDLLITKPNGNFVTMFPMDKANPWFDAASSIFK
ncbi:MAG: hypothetical protein MJE77_17435, partial [Proteobacteria bacterium]|nr:hypothetical protein [Pseudomonadota bacterium]